MSSYHYFSKWLNEDAIQELEKSDKVEFEDFLTQIIFTFLSDDIEDGDLFKLSPAGIKVWQWDGDRMREYD